MLYPNFKYRTNRFIHFFYEIFLHFLPAYLYDFVLRYNGIKPIMFKIAKRYKMAADTGEFFAMHEYNFGVDNVVELLDEIDASEDHEEFMCDVKQLDWDTYLKNYVLGIRKYILKDDLSTLKSARRTLKKYAIIVFLVFIQKFLLYNDIFLLQTLYGKVNRANHFLRHHWVHSLQIILLRKKLDDFLFILFFNLTQIILVKKEFFFFLNYLTNLKL